MRGAAGGLLGATALLLIFGGYVAERVVETTLEVAGRHRLYHLIKRLVEARFFWAIPLLFVVLGASAGIAGSLSAGGGRGLFSMVVFWYLAALLGLTRLLDRFVNLVAQRLAYLRETAPHILDFESSRRRATRSLKPRRTMTRCCSKGCGCPESRRTTSSTAG